MKPQGALDHASIAPIVADLFLGGLPAVQLPRKSAVTVD
jgi:TetR/AcrR family transcriptional regulator